MSQSEVAELYSREAVSMRHSLQRKLGNWQEAEDVMHDAYVRMLSAGPSETAVRSPKAFLLTIAPNLEVDCIRREQVAKKIFGPQPEETHEETGKAIVYEVVCPSPSVEDRVDSMMRLSRLEQLLEVLPPRCRTVFLAHKVMEPSHLEVARQLGVTASMVEKHVAKAAKHLRHYEHL